jgi:hypothetical protein
MNCLTLDVTNNEHSRSHVCIVAFPDKWSVAIKLGFRASHSMRRSVSASSASRAQVDDRRRSCTRWRKWMPPESGETPSAACVVVCVVTLLSLPEFNFVHLFTYRCI